MRMKVQLRKEEETKEWYLKHFVKEMDKYLLGMMFQESDDTCK